MYYKSILRMLTYFQVILSTTSACQPYKNDEAKISEIIIYKDEIDNLASLEAEFLSQIQCLGGKVTYTYNMPGFHGISINYSKVYKGAFDTLYQQKKELISYIENDSPVSIN